MFSISGAFTGAVYACRACGLGQFFSAGRTTHLERNWASKERTAPRNADAFCGLKKSARTLRAMISARCRVRPSSGAALRTACSGVVGATGDGRGHIASLIFGGGTPYPDALGRDRCGCMGV